MFDNKVNFNITSNSFEILKSKSGIGYKTIFFVIIVIVFLALHFSSIIEFTTPQYFDILLFITIAVNITYIIFVLQFKFNDVKFEKINNITYLNSKQVSTITDLKIINYDIKGGKKSSLYLRINGKEKSIVFSSNPDDVKVIAFKLSEFLNIKLENHYSSFYPIW